MKRSIIAARNELGEFDLIAKLQDNHLFVQGVAQHIITRMLKEGLITQENGVCSFTEKYQDLMEGQANE